MDVLRYVAPFYFCRIYIVYRASPIRFLVRNRTRAKGVSERRKPHPIGSVVRTAGAVAATILPILTAYLGFLFGQNIENKKRIDETERALFQQRMSLWVDVAADFEAFLQNREGLRKVARVERQLGKLSAQTTKLKSKYVDDRNNAHRRLMADLRKADLFFAEKVHSEIATFREFDSDQSERTLDTMASLDEFTKYEEAILSPMKVEVDRDIKRLKDISSNFEYFPIPRAFK